MLWSWELPTIGNAVSNGVLGAYVFVASNDAGFVWARNGARPVAVGPAHNSGDVWKYCGTVVESVHPWDAMSEKKDIGGLPARTNNTMSWKSTLYVQ